MQTYREVEAQIHALLNSTRSLPTLLRKASQTFYGLKSGKKQETDGTLACLAYTSTLKMEAVHSSKMS
jgi:hypothetical protein